MNNPDFWSMFGSMFGGGEGSAVKRIRSVVRDLYGSYAETEQDVKRLSRGIAMRLQEPDKTAIVRWCDAD